jgi:hypothetical protein
MFVIVLFCLCPHELLMVWNFNTFKSVALSRIVHHLFTIIFASHYSISIALHCAFVIICTSMSCCTFNCIYVDSCSFFATTFSSIAPFYTVYASTKWCSSTSSSSDSLMHTKSIDVTPSLSTLLHTNVICFCAKT